MSAYAVCFMRGMIRKLPLVLFAIAAFLAAAPLLHQHPLSWGSESSPATSSATCVVCAAGVNRLPDAAPAISAPLVVSYAIVAFVVLTLSHGVAITLPSRAPPSS